MKEFLKWTAVIVVAVIIANVLNELVVKNLIEKATA